MHTLALWNRVALRVQLSFLLFVHLYRKANFNPDQPRDELGRWRDAGQGKPELSERIRLATSDKPRLGRSALITIALEAAKKLIAEYRRNNGLFDLFGVKDGTVAVTTLNDKDIYGVNSNSVSYTTADRVAAEEMRTKLIQKYPDLMNTIDIGRRPNDALFHAEANTLLRAASENGGDLSGRRFEVYVDRAMCDSCKTILPAIGSELGNPTVTFVDPYGFRQTIRNGTWSRW